MRPIGSRNPDSPSRVISAQELVNIDPIEIRQFGRLPRQHDGSGTIRRMEMRVAAASSLSVRLLARALAAGGAILPVFFAASLALAQSPLSNELSVPLAADDSGPASLREAGVQLADYEANAKDAADLRTRAVLAWRTPVADYPAGSAALVALAGEAASSDDPVVLMLLATGCDVDRSPCDALQFARRWTGIDPQNAAAWLTVWAIASRIGDTPSAEASLVEVASSPEWHDYTRELNAALTGVVPDTAPLLVRLSARLQAIPRVVAIDNAEYREALPLCRLEAKRDTCLALADLLARSPTSLLELTVAASLAQRFGAEPAVVKERRQRIEAYQWALARRQPRGLRSDQLETDAPAAIAYFDHLQSRGEIEEAKTILAEMHLSESQAALRYEKERDASRAGHAPESGGGLRLPGR
jgi:hypothetical protein